VVIRDRIPGRPGRARDVPALEPVRPAHPHERDGAEQGDAGEPCEPRVLEPRRPLQRRRAAPPDPGVRVAVHARGHASL
jgi:hypothetical protein